jgi:hypothetical protein
VWALYYWLLQAMCHRGADLGRRNTGALVEGIRQRRTRCTENDRCSPRQWITRRTSSAVLCTRTMRRSSARHLLRTYSTRGGGMSPGSPPDAKRNNRGLVWLLVGQRVRGAWVRGQTVGYGRRSVLLEKEAPEFVTCAGTRNSMRIAGPLTKHPNAP